ncbi:MAG: hypothetical protein SOT68_03155, partial [Oscillospiraceae bacterium]|nr:hypothetical protein [Oscillospiraceae bacterium]MDY2863176.1 hypothetical protein [Oscillospiraceae bacterium]
VARRIFSPQNVETPFATLIPFQHFATPYRAWLYISQLLLGITLLYEELLLSYGIDYNALPHWQRYGAVLHYEQIEKKGTNRKTGEPVRFFRRELVLNEELPAGEKFGDYILELMDTALFQA